MDRWTYVSVEEASHRCRLDMEGFFEQKVLRASEDLLLKEALHIQSTPMVSLLNRDRGAEIHGCWITAVNHEAVNYQTLNFVL